MHKILVNEAIFMTHLYSSNTPLCVQIVLRFMTISGRIIRAKHAA